MSSPRSVVRYASCMVGGLVVMRRWQASSQAACQEVQKPSYYGSYSGDRFGGGIGRRVGLEERERRPLRGTGVVRAELVSETHGRLRAWATEANWREATRIHKSAYFTRSENLVQEAVLERIREHYVACTDSLDHRLVEAGLFRLEDEETVDGLLATTRVDRIPTVVFGVFNEREEKCVVDFANKRLGGGWLGYGMVQEEKMFIERFDLGALCARSLLTMPGDPVAEPLASPFSMHPNEAWILRGAPAYAHVGWYGRTPRDGLSRVQLLNPVDDVATSPTVVAIDAIKADFPVYEREHLRMMLAKAYTGFVAARMDPDLGGCSRIATGSWGCGAFLNNERVMFVVQTLAATLAGVELTHHVLGDGLGLGPAFELLERSLARKATVAEVLEELAQLCASNPEWRTKFDPKKHLRRQQPPPAAKL